MPIRITTPPRFKTPTKPSASRSPRFSQELKATPLKLPEKICVVCGKDSNAQLRYIQSVASSKKGLQKLIEKYGGVNITHGYICHADEEKLMNMGKKAEAFRIQMQKNLSSLSSNRIKWAAVRSPKVSPSPGTLKATRVSAHSSTSPSRNKLPPQYSSSDHTTPQLKSKAPKKTFKKKLFSTSTPQPVLPKPPRTESMAIPLADHPYGKLATPSDHLYGKDSQSKKQTKSTPNITPSPSEHTYSHRKTISQMPVSEIACNIASNQNLISSAIFLQLKYYP